MSNTNYPGSLDTFTDPMSTQYLNNPSHSAQHGLENDAIAALQTKVGVDSSAVTTTVDYLLKNTASVDPGHKHSTSSISGTIAPTQGGTGVASPTAHAVAVAEGSGNYTFVAPGSSGTVLTSNGVNADPTFQSSTTNQLFSSFTALEAISAGAPVAIGLLQSLNIGIDTTGTTTSTGSVTIGNNSNRALLVIAFGSGVSAGSPVISGTFAGQTLPFTSNHYLDAGSNSYAIATAILVAPPTGSGTFSLASSGGIVQSVFYHSVYNAAQTSPQDNTAAAFTTPTSTTASVSMGLNTDGALAFGVIYNGSSISVTPAGNVYNSNTVTNTAPAYAYGNSGVSNIFPVNTVMSLSISSGTAANWQSALLSIKPFTAVSEGLLNASSASVATSNTRCTGFLGFAKTSQSSGQSLAAVLNGIITGLTGLILGQEYYLNDTNGTIGTSAGTNTRKVGVATSASSLLITNIW